jgi:ABC-type xylose transport system permease subunit
MASSNLVEETEKVNAALKVANAQVKKAEEAASAAANSQIPVQVGKQWWRADEAMTISASVLIFGVLVMVLMTIALRKTSLSPDSILRLFGTTIIITGALFLIVAGYTETQMGPVMGLLGTIAGYLLGKNSNSPSASHKDEA